MQFHCHEKQSSKGVAKGMAQKPPVEVFCMKRRTKKFRKIQRKTPVSESLLLKRESGTGIFL